MIKKVEEAKIVLACEDDPVLFAEIACMCNNIELYDWQKELLNPKPFTVIYERANEGLNSFKRPHIIDA